MGWMGHALRSPSWSVFRSCAGYVRSITNTGRRLHRERKKQETEDIHGCTKSHGGVPAGVCRGMYCVDCGSPLNSDNNKTMAGGAGTARERAWAIRGWERRDWMHPSRNGILVCPGPLEDGWAGIASHPSNVRWNLPDAWYSQQSMPYRSIFRPIGSTSDKATACLRSTEMCSFSFATWLV